MSILSFPSLRALLLLWLLKCAITAVNGEWICNANANNIYAADNLHNGTIRLYSDKHYWNLELFSLKTENISLMGLEKFDFLASFSLIGDDNGYNESESQYRLYAFADIERSHSIERAYEGLNFSLLDEENRRYSMMSLTDSAEVESTMLFKSSSIRRNESDVGSRNDTDSGDGQAMDNYFHTSFSIWETRSGKFQYESIIPDINIAKNRVNAMHNDQRPQFVSAVFNVQLNGSQIMFMIIQNTMYWTKIEVKSFNLDYQSTIQLNLTFDVKNPLFHGKILSPLTAAFVLQPAADRIWIVLVQCDRFCLVPWNQMKNYFDFTKCQRAESFRDLGQFFALPPSPPPPPPVSLDELQTLANFTDDLSTLENETMFIPYHNFGTKPLETGDERFNVPNMIFFGVHYRINDDNKKPVANLTEFDPNSPTTPPPELAPAWKVLISFFIVILVVLISFSLIFAFNWFMSHLKNPRSYDLSEAENRAQEIEAGAAAAAAAAGDDYHPSDAAAGLVSAIVPVSLHHSRQASSSSMMRNKAKNNFAEASKPSSSQSSLSKSAE